MERHDQTNDPIQGEGDYRASREYREDVQDFLAHADVEKAARDAAPRSPAEAAELEEAEASGRARARAGTRRAQSAARSLGRRLRERPVTAIVVAGALGYLIARSRHRARRDLA